MKIRKKKDYIKEKGAVPEESSLLLKSMVSPELLGLLKNKNSENLFENYIETEIINMYINNCNFLEIIHSMRAKEVFMFINKFLNRAVPIIYENGGVIESFQEAGMNILILEEYENTLSLAVSLCELLNELKLENREGFYGDFSIGLSFENVILGVVGHEKRMSMSALSADAPGLSKWLLSIAGKYYSKIIAPDLCLDKIGEVRDRFNMRLLGCIYITATGRMHKIYDIFEGDTPETRNLKRQTKIAFEKGVSLYLKGIYQEARKYFIEVLKTDNKDRAAREYIYLCEKAREQGRGTQKMYIEKW